MDKFGRGFYLVSRVFSYQLQTTRQVNCPVRSFQTSPKKKPNTSGSHNKETITKGSSETLLKAFSNKHPALLGGPSLHQNDVQDFECLGLRHDLCYGLKTLNIRQPTPIQVDTIQKVLENQNVLCASQTGSGKTLAYLLPIIHLLKNDEETGLIPRQRRPRVCVVVPFRELAVQVLGVVKSLSHFVKLRSLGLISGRKKKFIREGLESPLDVVVCTPHTLLKYQEKGDIYLSDLSHIVMDEADTMFDGSFVSLAVDILKHAGVANGSWRNQKPRTQTTFVTTTVPQEMFKIIDSILPNMQVCSADLHRVLPHVSQKFLKISQHKKSELLLDIISKQLHKLASQQIMIFCNTTKSCDWTSFFLEESNIAHSRLNGNMNKKDRREHLNIFQERKTSVLVCTDMASRGLDTTNVAHVINFDFPPSVVDYIHRAGRTGRLGYKDTAINPHVTSFLSHNREIVIMEQIKNAVQQNIPLQDAALWGSFKRKKPKKSL